MKLLSLSSFKENPDGPTTARPSLSSWPWLPNCHQPKTLSFRATTDDVFRTINSVFQLDPPEPRRTNSSDSEPPEPDDDDDDDDEDAAAIEAARSERRLFFDPEATSSMVAASGIHAPFIKESVAMSMESRDPYFDFRQSMVEVVEAHALKDRWDRLEELLCWYLAANDKANHGYIFAAFVDLLDTVRPRGGGGGGARSPPCNLSPSSPLLSYTSTSNSCCSSSTLSTPCCVSVMEAEESSSDSVAAVRPCSSSS